MSDASCSVLFDGDRQRVRVSRFGINVPIRAVEISADTHDIAEATPIVGIDTAIEEAERVQVSLPYKRTGRMHVLRLRSLIEIWILPSAILDQS